MDEMQLIYDEFAKTYESNRGQFNMDHIISDFEQVLDIDPGNLLDLGCGAGEPIPKHFIDKGWSVVGVDFSQKMLELAKQYVPKMKTLQSDITQVTFAPQQFHAITAIYSLFHIPNDKHTHVFRNMYKWLKPQGKALFTYATEKYTGKSHFNGYKQFLGKNLFYSHKDVNSLLNDLSNIGFSILAQDYREIGGETFLWVTVGKNEQ